MKFKGVIWDVKPRDASDVNLFRNCLNERVDILPFIVIETVAFNRSR